MKKTLLILFAALFAVMGANAADAYKTLTFSSETNGESISSYSNSWKATIGTDTWTLTNFNNNKNAWKYVKCGHKSTAYVASIASPSIDQAIGSIVVTLDEYNAAKVNKFYLEVATDAAFSNVTETIEATDAAAGDYTFKTTKAAAGNYYRLVWDCAVGSKNGFVVVSKVQYFKSGDAPEVVDISNTPETAYSTADAIKLIEAGQGLATWVYVKGKIVSILSTSVNSTYGSINYFISDDGTTTNQIEAYGGLGLNGEKFNELTDIAVGDEVIIYGALTKYNSTYELNKNNYLVSHTPTGINAISTDADADAPAYTIGGVKAGKGYKGIVIKNGKKTLVK